MKYKVKAQLKRGMAVTKLRIGDKVVIIAGKSKGEVGNLTQILRKKNAAIVHGINIGYKAVKPNPSRDEQGGIKPIERPINLSNIAIFNPSTGKADKLGYKFDENGKKLRIYKSNDEVVVAQK